MRWLPRTDKVRVSSCKFIFYFQCLYRFVIGFKFVYSLCVTEVEDQYSKDDFYSYHPAVVHFIPNIFIPIYRCHKLIIMLILLMKISGGGVCMFKACVGVMVRGGERQVTVISGWQWCISFLGIIFVNPFIAATITAVNETITIACPMCKFR